MCPMAKHSMCVNSTGNLHITPNPCIYTNSWRWISCKMTTRPEYLWECIFEMSAWSNVLLNQEHAENLKCEMWHDLWDKRSISGGASKFLIIHISELVTFFTHSMPMCIYVAFIDIWPYIGFVIAFCFWIFYQITGP